MLASQMAIAHCAFMRIAATHAAASDPLREQIYEKQVNRFARTFNAQMHALKVYRGNLLSLSMSLKELSVFG